MEKSPPKFSLTEWRRHTPTILLIFAVNIIWGLLFLITSRSDDNTENAYRLLEEHKKRADKFENLVFEFSRALMYKEAQLKNRDFYIDSILKAKTDSVTRIKLFKNEN